MMVAIIVPCYNQAQWLDETLESVLVQSYSNWECVIVNDGSTDDSQETALKWVLRDRRFKLINQPNGGLSAARNTGIKETDAEFVLPLDSDDKIDPDYISLAIDEFVLNPDLKLVYGRVAFFGETHEEWQLPEFKWDQFLLQNCIYCSAMFRRIDWEKAGGYCEDLKHGLEDWDLWMSMLDVQSKVKKIDKVLFYYRQRQGSMLKELLKKSDDRMLNAINSVYIRHLEKYIECFGHPLQVIRSRNHLLKEKDAWQNSWRYKFGTSIIKWIKK